MLMLPNLLKSLAIKMRVQLAGLPANVCPSPRHLTISHEWAFQSPGTPTKASMDPRLIQTLSFELRKVTSSRNRIFFLFTLRKGELLMKDENVC